MRVVIEHLEPEVFEWCEIEYRHISRIFGKENIVFSNVGPGAEKLALLGDVHHERANELGLDMKRVCVLDPEAERTLTPLEAGRFGTFVLGGILGDDPPQARTKDALTKTLPGAAVRDLGKEQMSTDTAALVLKRILDGIPLEKMRFVSPLHIHIQEGEEVILPYRYLLDSKGVPLLAEGLVDMLRKSEDF